MTSALATLVPMHARSLWWRATGAAIAVGGLGYVYVVDPHEGGNVMPLCPTHLVTGLDCPACGGLRLAHDVLHLDLGAAVHDNLFLLIALPVLALLAVGRHVARRAGLRTEAFTRRAGFAVLGVAVVWTIVRNLPGFPLQPLLY